MDKIQIRFDGPPEHEAGRFVEVEDAQGASICIGEWRQDGDDWLLVMDDPRALRAENERLTKDLANRDRILNNVVSWAVEEDSDNIRFGMQFTEECLQPQIACLTAERDAALAEGAVLREALGLVDSDLLEWHTRYALVGLQPMFELIGRCRQHIDYARGEVPLVSAHLAELERLRRVEKAARGLNDCPPSPHNGWWKELSAALAAYDAARGGGGGSDEVS